MPIVEKGGGGDVPLYWIGGWASDLQCWGELLQAHCPGFDLRFVDAHTVLQGDARMERMLSSAPPGACVVGWSLGSLILERLLRQGRIPPELPVLSICPFLDFCDPTGPWKPQILRRMVRRIFGDAAGVLSDFADRLGLEGEERSVWFRQALELGEESLAEGLTLLQNLRFDMPWASHPLRLFAIGPDDPVSPKCEVPRDSRRDLPMGSGHVPFLRHPEAMRKILLELAGKG
jgi:pimeloyl-ACP methyl ester carboxylesterase